MDSKRKKLFRDIMAKIPQASYEMEEAWGYEVMVRSPEKGRIYLKRCEMCLKDVLQMIVVALG